MTQQELDKIIQDSNRSGTRVMLTGKTLVRLSMQWDNMRGADMQGANMRGANMRGADMRGANMRGANMRGADMQWDSMRGADMREADMRETDIDYASWPLSGGSLEAYIDDRITIQLLYHVLSPAYYSPYVSDEIKQALLTPELVAIANRFHRVAMGDCEELSTYDAACSKKRAARDAGTSTSGKENNSKPNIAQD